VIDQVNFTGWKGSSFTGVGGCLSRYGQKAQKALVAAGWPEYF
jgi:hypothetical protein